MPRALPSGVFYVNLPLPIDLLREIDRDRGDVPRTAWIRRACQARLALEADGLADVYLLGDEDRRMGRPRP